MAEPTETTTCGFWNGEPCHVERAIVVVADAPDHPHYWAKRFVGNERRVVLVNYKGSQFAIDDEGYDMSVEEIEALKERWPGITFSTHHGFPGWGWEKVTKGRGSPSYPHASVVFERVVSTEQDRG